MENKKKSQKLINDFEKSNFLEESVKSSSRLKAVFDEALKVNNRKLIIVGDSGDSDNKVSSMLSYAYFSKAKEMGLDANLIFQKPRDRTHLISEEILDELRSQKEGAIFMMTSSARIGTLNGLGKSFRNYCKSKNFSFTSASNLFGVPMSEYKTLIDAHTINYKAMQQKQERLKLEIDAASEVHVSTKAGTDITMGIRDGLGVYNHGIYDKPGMGGNVPAGEIYVPIDKRVATGRLVVDLSSRQKDGSVLCKEPIDLDFKDGVIQSIKGGKEAKGLEKTFKWAESRAKFPWGIRMAAELGIGLNKKAKVVGATILDEKVYGTAHIATGSNKWFGGKIAAIVHLDHVFDKPTIKLDGKKLNI